MYEWALSVTAWSLAVLSFLLFLASIAPGRGEGSRLRRPIGATAIFGCVVNLFGLAGLVNTWSSLVPPILAGWLAVVVAASSPVWWRNVTMVGVAASVALWAVAFLSGETNLMIVASSIGNGVAGWLIAASAIISWHNSPGPEWGREHESHAGIALWIVPHTILTLALLVADGSTLMLPWIVGNLLSMTGALILLRGLWLAR